MISRIVNGRLWQSQPTYRWEYLVAAAYLASVTVVSLRGASAVGAVAQVLGSAAVFATFGHMSVASRLEEAQERTSTKTVECYRKLTRYLVVKEALWLVTFVLLGAWTPLAGIPLFILYPAWRKA